MDFLKATISSEINKRKKVYQTAANDKAPGLIESSKKQKRYVTALELENSQKLIQEASDQAQDTIKQPQDFLGHQKASQDKTSPRLLSESSSKFTSFSEHSTRNDDLNDYNISEFDVIKKLRSRGEPIRLFAETDKQRKIRLRTLELKDEKSEGQRNDFMKALEEMESGNLLEELKKKANFNEEEKLKAKKKLDVLMEYDTTLINPKLFEQSPDKIYTLVYAYFKRMLYEWEEYLHEYHDQRQTTAGKLAAATQRQSSEYMKPFFRQLKKKTIDDNVIARITEIAMYMQQREYVKANDAYLRLAIGNSPWPIGVTMVGIHERSARENIHASKVAHVLNDETQRKWIQSIKRLMTFAQTKYPPSDLAKRVG